MTQALCSVSTAYHMDTRAFLASLLQRNVEQVVSRFTPCQAKEEVTPIQSDDGAIEEVVCGIYVQFRSYARKLASYDIARRACLDEEDLLSIAAMAVLVGLRKRTGFNLKQMWKYANLRGKGAMMDELDKARLRTVRNVSMDELMEGSFSF